MGTGFYSPLVETSIVDTEAEGTAGFLDKQNWGRSGGGRAADESLGRVLFQPRL